MAIPELKTRRAFMKSAVLGGALTWTVPTFLARTFDALGADLEMAGRTKAAADLPVLVVLQLAGGNDGLNTVVPWNNDHYRRARPKLAIARGALLPVNDDYAFPTALSGFRDLVESGHLAVIHGVGYPNPNRSHFRSMEIWQTASDADRVERRGWMGRYFDCCCQGAEPTVGVAVGRTMPQAFQARRPTGVSVAEPGRRSASPWDDDPAEKREDMRRDEGGESQSTTGEMALSGDSIGGVTGGRTTEIGLLDYLDRTALDAQISDQRMRQIAGKTSNTVAYPGTALGQSLKQVAQWIGGRLPTRVFYLSHGGFDTHRGQTPTHERLLKEFGEGMKAFVADLKGLGVLERVLVLAFSEFGRRVAENASGGTDHGAAGPVFLFGRQFRAPWVGKYPSLDPAELVRGDLRYGVDFRSVYAEALEGWLGISGEKSERILGRRFERLGIV